MLIAGSTGGDPMVVLTDWSVFLVTCARTNCKHNVISNSSLCFSFLFRFCKLKVWEDVGVGHESLVKDHVVTSRFTPSI